MVVIARQPWRLFPSPRSVPCQGQTWQTLMPPLHGPCQAERVCTQKLPFQFSGKPHKKDTWSPWTQPCFIFHFKNQQTWVWHHTQKRHHFWCLRYFWGDILHSVHIQLVFPLNSCSCACCNQNHIKNHYEPVFANHLILFPTYFILFRASDLLVFCFWKKESGSRTWLIWYRF